MIIENRKVTRDGVVRQILAACNFSNTSSDQDWIGEVQSSCLEQTQKRPVAPFSNEEHFIQKTLVSAIDRIMDTLASFAVSFNRSADSEGFMTVTSPWLNTGIAGAHAKANSSYRGRISARNWSLVIASNQKSIEFSLVPSSQILNAKTQKLSPLIVLHLDSRKGSAIWTFQNREITSKDFTSLCKESFKLLVEFIYSDVDQIVDSSALSKRIVLERRKASDRRKTIDRKKDEKESNVIEHSSNVIEHSSNVIEHSSVTTRKCLEGETEQSSRAQLSDLFVSAEQLPVITTKPTLSGKIKRATAYPRQHGLCIVASNNSEEFIVTEPEAIAESSILDELGNEANDSIGMPCPERTLDRRKLDNDSKLLILEPENISALAETQSQSKQLTERLTNDSGQENAFNLLPLNQEILVDETKNLNVGSTESNGLQNLDKLSRLTNDNAPTSHSPETKTIYELEVSNFLDKLIKSADSSTLSRDVCLPSNEVISLNSSLKDGDRLIKKSLVGVILDSVNELLSVEQESLKELIRSGSQMFFDRSFLGAEECVQKAILRKRSVDVLSSLGKRWRELGGLDEFVRSCGSEISIVPDSTLSACNTEFRLKLVTDMLLKVIIQIGAKAFEVCNFERAQKASKFAKELQSFERLANEICSEIEILKTEKVQVSLELVSNFTK